MPQPEKIKKVEAISESLNQANSIFMTDFSGLSVEDITQLRREFRKEKVNFIVVKNTLAKIAAEKVGLQEMTNFLTGPTGLALATEDPIAPIRIIDAFQKQHDKPKVKAAILEGKLLGEDEVNSLKDIPPREVLLGQVVSGIASPLTGFVGALQGMLRNLVYALNAIKEQKES